MGKYRSRAKRASETADKWRDVVQSLRDVADKGISEYTATKADKKAHPDMEDDEVREMLKVKEAQIALEDLDEGEFEDLKSEMESWRDNMSGTNLENTDKGQRVSEACDVLDGIDISGKEISEIDDIETVADELEAAADELESVDFPGMYS